MGRTVFIGDVHGCRDELDALLERVAFSAGDRLVMVGDLVVRGPNPHGTLALLRAAGAVSVRGNHEDRLLRNRERPESCPLGDLALATAKALRRRDWAMIASLPLWLDLPAHGVRVVHAAVAAGAPIERQAPRALMYARSIDATGALSEAPGPRLWAASYEGPPHVVFGHNARVGLQLHRWATGLDTGCVYGGALTAMVLGPGEAPPPPADRRGVLVSVRARRSYLPPR